MKHGHEGVDGADIGRVYRVIPRDIADDHRVQLSIRAETGSSPLGGIVLGQRVQPGNHLVAVHIAEVGIDVNAVGAHRPRDSALVDHDIAKLKKLLDLIHAQSRRAGAGRNKRRDVAEDQGRGRVAEIGFQIRVVEGSHPAGVGNQNEVGIVLDPFASLHRRHHMRQH